MITVVVVSWFSSGYLAELVKNLHTKAEQPETVQFLIVDNTNGLDREIQALCEMQSCATLHRLDNRGLKGSRAHAFALDYATSRIETPYALVTDPDVHVFKRAWDRCLVEELQKKSAVAIGAPYVSWKLGKYHDFPSPLFMLFDTAALRTLGIDWTPFPGNPVRSAYNFVARQIVRMGFLCTRARLAAHPVLGRTASALESLFGVCGPDTGYRVAAAARRLRAKAILFDEASERNDFVHSFKWGAAARDLAREYELYYYGEEPMMVHKYSTGSYFWKTTRGDDMDFWRDSIRQLESALQQNGEHD